MMPNPPNFKPVKTAGVWGVMTTYCRNILTDKDYKALGIQNAAIDSFETAVSVAQQLEQAWVKQEQRLQKQRLKKQS